MNTRIDPSRRALLRGAGASIVLPVLHATQGKPKSGLEALLDGSGLVRIPPGTFLMGSRNGVADEQPVHRVRITRAFEMGKFEVTQALWESVMHDPHAKASTE